MAPCSIFKSGVAVSKHLFRLSFLDNEPLIEKVNKQTFRLSSSLSTIWKCPYFLLLVSKTKNWSLLIRSVGTNGMFTIAGVFLFVVGFLSLVSWFSAKRFASQGTAKIWPCFFKPWLSVGFSGFFSSFMMGFSLLLAKSFLGSTWGPGVKTWCPKQHRNS